MIRLILSSSPNVVVDFESQLTKSKLKRSQVLKLAGQILSLFLLSELKYAIVEHLMLNCQAEADL